MAARDHRWADFRVYLTRMREQSRLTSSPGLAGRLKVMEALERLMKGRTTFMIAHRLTTLASCDIRLQIENRRVIQREGDVSDVEMS